MYAVEKKRNISIAIKLRNADSTLPKRISNIVFTLFLYLKDFLYSTFDILVGNTKDSSSQKKDSASQKKEKWNG